MFFGSKTQRKLEAPRPLSDEGLGSLIFMTLLENEGRMRLNELLTVLIRKNRVPCRFEGQVFEVEFVIGAENYPEMLVYPQDGRKGWRVSLGGPGSSFFRGFYSKLGDRVVLSVQGHSIRCEGSMGMLHEQTTIEDLTGFLGRRIFALCHESRVLKKREIGN